MNSLHVNEIEQYVTNTPGSIILTMNHPSLGEFTFVRIIFCGPTTLGHPSTQGQPLPLSMTRRVNISLLTTGDQDQLSPSSKTPTAVDPDISYQKKNEFFHVKEWHHLPDPRIPTFETGSTVGIPLQAAAALSPSSTTHGGEHIPVEPGHTAAPPPRLNDFSR